MALRDKSIHRYKLVIPDAKPKVGFICCLQATIGLCSHTSSVEHAKSLVTVIAVTVDVM